MSNKKDPLEDLFINGDQINKELLRDVLSSLILIDKKTSKPVLQPLFYELNIKHKLIAYLLYRRILLLLSVIEAKQLGITGIEIEHEIGIKQGSLYPEFRSLNRIIGNSKEMGGYYILDHSLNAAILILREVLRKACEKLNHERQLK